MGSPEPVIEHFGAGPPGGGLGLSVIKHFGRGPGGGWGTCARGAGVTGAGGAGGTGTDCVTMHDFGGGMVGGDGTLGGASSANHFSPSSPAAPQPRCGGDTTLPTSDVFAMPQMSAMLPLSEMTQWREGTISPPTVVIWLEQNHMARDVPPSAVASLVKNACPFHSPVCW